MADRLHPRVPLLREPALGQARECSSSDFRVCACLASKMQIQRWAQNSKCGCVMCEACRLIVRRCISQSRVAALAVCDLQPVSALIECCVDSAAQLMRRASRIARRSQPFAAGRRKRVVSEAAPAQLQLSCPCWRSSTRFKPFLLATRGRMHLHLDHPFPHARTLWPLPWYEESDRQVTEPQRYSHTN